MRGDEIPQGMVVKVRRQFNDYNIASYRIENIGGFHWDCISGGVKSLAAFSSIYAYVSCDKAISGEVAHSCAHGDFPHRIKVCILKKDNPDTYHYIKSLVGDNPDPPKYFAKQDAVEAYKAIIENKKHPALIRKGDLIIINPQNIPVINGSSSRSKSFRVQLMRLMENNEDFVRDKYRSMLAYRKVKNTR